MRRGSCEVDVDLFLRAVLRDHLVDAVDQLRDLLDEAVSRGRLSARGVDKVIRLSWTIADLAGAAKPRQADVQLALAMRRGDEIEEVRCG